MKLSEVKVDASRPILVDLLERALARGEEVMFHLPNVNGEDVVRVIEVFYGDTKMFHGTAGKAKALRYHGPALKLSYKTSPTRGGHSGTFTFADKTRDLGEWQLKKVDDIWHLRIEDEAA